MKSYQQFTSIAEKYYAPNEPLPSGKTPVEKYTKKLNKTQNPNLKSAETQVKRGSQNPKLDISSHPDLDISTHGEEPFTFTRFHHKPTGITYNVSDDGEIDWDHNNQNINRLSSMKDRTRILRNAKTVWNQHIQDRLPYGKTMYSFSSKKKARSYERHGMSPADDVGYQFAKVGRSLSKNEKKKGKSRLSPTNKPEDFEE